MWHDDSCKPLNAKTKPSRILLRTGVSYIGLKLELIEVGRGTLFIGKTLAHFHLINR